MIVRTKDDAWREADRIFPTDYLHNSELSHRAGYDIYYSTLDGCEAWISDLGNSLEINLPDGKTTKISIQPDRFPSYDFEEAINIIDDCLYSLEDKLPREMLDMFGIDEAVDKLNDAFRQVYEGYRKYYPKHHMDHIVEDIDEGYGPSYF